MDCFVGASFAMAMRTLSSHRIETSSLRVDRHIRVQHALRIEFHRFGSIGGQLVTAINTLLTIFRHPFARGLLDTVCVSQNAVYRFVPVTAFLAFRLVE